MSDILFSLLAGGAAGAACAIIVSRQARSVPQAISPDSPKAVAAEPTPAAEVTPAAPAPATPVALEPIAVVLPRLIRALNPMTENLEHPSELTDMPEFLAVLEVFRREDATFALLTQFALGANWAVSCAAFNVLCTHPERDVLRDRVVARLDGVRPFLILYMLQFLNTLKRRPPVGAAILEAPPWWQNNPVVPGFFQEYFETASDRGDRAWFGDLLAGLKEPTHAAAEGLLAKIAHPYARTLLALLREWSAGYIDTAFLASIGSVWNARDRDKLLIDPPAWASLLTQAQSAILQPRPRSVLVCGEARVGKTSLVQILAGRLEDAGWTVFSAAANELQADQMYIGQLEGRIRKLIGALHPRRKIVWFVRDLAHIAGSGAHASQSATILEQIQPALAAGTLVIIGEATQAAAARLFQGRPSLRPLLEVVPMLPMGEDETAELVGELARRVTSSSGLAVSEQAVAATMELAVAYMGAGQLPGSALELLKRAAERSINTHEAELTADSAIRTLSQTSGLPLEILDTRQRADLAEMRAFFTRRVIGQDEAVRAVVDRIAMLKAGLTDPNRPIAVFLLAGPTGTGKTELAKTLAEYLFGSPDRMARLDMSEFQHADATSKILGQREDRGTDSLINRIRKQPFSVVLLDEFEKAHANCWDLFLQIFDDGRLSDADGREADFRHCFIILTSNLGARAHQGAALGFSPAAGEYGEEQVLRAVAQAFRPEFVNRLDKIIVFKPLTRALMRSVLRKELARVEERRGLRDRAWAVEWEASALDFLLDRGFSAEMGARPLKRAIDQFLLAPLAATLVEHRFPEGDQFLFVRSDGKAIQVEFVDPDAAPVADAAPVLDAEGEVSLQTIILRQTGASDERAVLRGVWKAIGATLSGEAWSTMRDRQGLALADPEVWTRSDRFKIFSAMEVADRIGEASRTAERLFDRFEAAGGQTARTSRELAGRLALQLYNIQQGIDDVAGDAPVDVLLRVEAALDRRTDAAAAVWCTRLTGMYRLWAAKRRMRVQEFTVAGPKADVILHIVGFGAFRTLLPEAGLHVFEDSALDGDRRVVARVFVAAGPEQAFPATDRFASAQRLLAAEDAGGTIVRRYRGAPGPMVRDMVQGWRSGRLDAVLSGDFDLIGSVARQQAAE